MLFAAVHLSAFGTKRHSRHRNILSAIGQERTLAGSHSAFVEILEARPVPLTWHFTLKRLPLIWATLDPIGV